VNLGVKIKLYLDAKHDNTGERDARQNLLDFYDALPLAEDLKQVTKGEFKEVFETSRGQKKKKRKTANLAVLQEYQSIGEPPAPNTPASASAPSTRNCSS
jgi:hypothetical protein